MEPPDAAFSVSGKKRKVVKMKRKKKLVRLMAKEAVGIYAVAKTKTRWSLNPYQTFCPGSKCALGHSRIIKLDRRHYTSHSVLGSIGVQSFVK